MKTRKQAEKFRDAVEKYLDKQAVTTKKNNYWRGIAHALRWMIGDIKYDMLSEMLPEEA